MREICYGIRGIHGSVDLWIRGSVESVGSLDPWDQWIRGI